MMHSETVTMQEALDADPAEAVAGGARIYLQFGPAPLSELVRVLSQHLGAGRGTVEALVRRLIKDGTLAANGYQVSLPAGGVRETEEQR